MNIPLLVILQKIIITLSEGQCTYIAFQFSTRLINNQESNCSVVVIIVVRVLPDPLKIWVFYVQNVVSGLSQNRKHLALFGQGISVNSLCVEQ